MIWFFRLLISQGAIGTITGGAGFALALVLSTLVLPHVNALYLAISVGLVSGFSGWVLDAAFGLTSDLHHAIWNREKDLAKKLLAQSGHYRQCLERFLRAEYELNTPKILRLIHSTPINRNIYKNQIWIVRYVLPLLNDNPSIQEEITKGNINNLRKYINEMVEILNGIQLNRNLLKNLFDKLAPYYTAKQIKNTWENRQKFNQTRGEEVGIQRKKPEEEIGSIYDK